MQMKYLKTLNVLKGEVLREAFLWIASSSYGHFSFVLLRFFKQSELNRAKFGYFAGFVQEVTIRTFFLWCV